jgi:hypothetical protein
MTAYVGRSRNECGNSLVLTSDAGAGIFQALKTERQDIDAELSATGYTKTIWEERQGQCWVVAWRRFSNGWTAEQEPAQLAWLLAATNTFVNTFRPRVLRLLRRSGLD